MSVFMTLTYEPDAPIFTSRICGICHSDAHARFVAGLAIARKSLLGFSCDRSVTWYEDIPQGLGFCLTTYSADGDPPPAFRGDPLLVPLTGRMEEIAERYWMMLNEANRVSLAVKFIRIGSGESSVFVINQYQKQV